MKAYDSVNKVDLGEVTVQQLVDIMATGGRQVELALYEPKTDSDGYLTWDTEYWTSLDGRRFMRCYSLNGRQLRDSTAHNTYDLRNDFHPEDAKTVTVS